ncbi:MAG: hypothetical protein US52_C0014G0003 [candidate division WS6 bacterium GW2011_GWA2_37_6]|uniref:Type II secretion system protein n=1 Tax=candidate division WS6 bacterium GW2011_GWA2_37_6 TaxID=1619087 RepID=A0A0G0GXZ5_9BACT|nr:MAG: hypothetical protein US52_C0014G0003 [candidate division WS6 bacterium GW2011_GWA2_37_6]
MKIMLKMMKNILICKKNRLIKAYTLIEVILYFALFTSILGVVLGFMTVIQQNKSRNFAVSSVDRQASQVIETMNYTIRNADSVNIPTQGAQSSTLSINVDSAPLSPSVFDLNSGKIRLQEGANPVKELTSSDVTVTNLNFYNLSTGATNEVIRVEFTITYNNPDNRREKKFSHTYYSTITLR